MTFPFRDPHGRPPQGQRSHRPGMPPDAHAQVQTPGAPPAQANAVWPTRIAHHPPDPTEARSALRLGLAVVLVLVAGLGGWGSFASIDGAIVAAGQIEALHARVSLQHPDGGRVADILVQNGQVVQAGEPLLRLDGSLLQIEREVVELQHGEGVARAARLQAERDALADLVIPAGLLAPTQPLPPGISGSLGHGGAFGAQIDAQRRLLAARREAMRQQIAQLENRQAQSAMQQTGLSAQILALEVEAALVAEELVQQEELLDRGLAPTGRVNHLRREGARLAGARGVAQAESAALSGRITEIDLHILTLHANRREEAEAGLRDLAVTLPELAARRRALDDRLQRLELRAPLAGQVHALAVAAPGALLRPGETVAEIVPVTDAPRIAVRIRPEDRDRIQTGQSARVLLPGSGGRARTELEGWIARISAETFEDPRTADRFFSAEITLDQPGLRALGDRVLLPGLPIEAQIRTGARSPIAWILSPLSVHVARAFREE